MNYVKSLKAKSKSLRSLAHKVRYFDYSDLRFLYIACLVTIALVYTIFRGSQFLLNRQETDALNAIQQIDVQRDLTAEMERQIAYAQNWTSPQYAATVQALISTYLQAQRNQQSIVLNSTMLRRACAQRKCGEIFTVPFFSESNRNLTGILTNTRLRQNQHNAILQHLFDELVRYRSALRDTLELSFELIRVKNRTTLTFEILAYVALITLLLTQAIYIFRPAIRRINDSLSVRSDFLSRISHEIRNPMNSIIGMADILRGTRLNYEQQQYVENLIRSGNALLDMLNNLIDFSVIEGGKLTLKPCPFDLFVSLDRDINLISIPAHHKNLNVQVEVDPRVNNRLIGDPVRLDQVLVNLLNNAVKFTETGQILLRVELERETDDLVQLTFSVSDSGIGIPENQLEEIFESFVQGDSSIQRKYGGSGLGLSISREIIRLKDSNLQVESTLGKGSRFYFTIALNKQAPREGIDPKPLTGLSGRHFIIMTAAPDAGFYREQFERLNCRSEVLQSTHQLEVLLGDKGSAGVSEILIDDSVGIISMINCRNLAGERNLGDRTVALLRSNFTKENMDLLRRNGFTRFMIKPMKQWELLALPTPIDDENLSVNSTGVPIYKPLIQQLKERQLSILLVDDSNDNLFLLKELVQPIARDVHFAENGLEAIEKFRTNRYDVVFMDIQMPVMDGYTAIRKMRELEEGTSQRVPIYAVTAHAGLVDAQKCREAGFTDRIVKPVLRTDIYESLKRAFGLESREGEPHVAPSVPEKYLAKLLPTYFKTRDDDLQKLDQALQNEDFKALKNLGHKIKGSSASYGFPMTSQMSLSLEQAALESNLEACQGIVAELHKQVNDDRSRLMPAISPNAIS